MNTPNTPAPSTPATSPPMVGPDFPKHGLSPAEAKTMAECTKQDLASGKITQAQADAQFVELNVPIEQRGLTEDLRTTQQVQLDAAFPAAKPAEYIIQYDKPGQAPPMDAVQKQNLQKFDTTARDWLSTAGFPREMGNSLVSQITRVVEATNGITVGDPKRSLAWAGRASRDHAGNDIRKGVGAVLRDKV